MPEQPRLLVGYEGGETGHDALVFAGRWRRSSGDAVTVVTVHPGAAPAGFGRVDAEWVAYERGAADALVEQARALLPDLDPADFRRVDAGSPAHGLHDAVESADVTPAMVVLGSRRTRGLRRTFPGSTAERLLQGSPAPVAMVPWGYADTPDRPLERVAVAYVDTPEGRAAVDHALVLADRLSASLTVLSIVPDTRVVPGLGEPGRFGAARREDYRASLDAVVADVSGTSVEVTGALLDGPVVDALTELGLDEHDLLVCGSRGYGPVRRVLLGGVSSRVVRHSKIPVVVVPRAG